MPGHIDEANGFRASRTRQLPKLLRVLTRRWILTIQMNQDSPLTTTGTFEEQ